MRSGYLAVMLLCFCSSVQAAEDALFAFGADATVQFDDNQSRAERRRDQVEDVSVLVSADVSTDFQPGDGFHLVTLRGFVELEKFSDIDTLDRTSVGGSAAWRWQPTAAFTAPIFQLSASAQEDMIETDQRDAFVNRVQGFVTRRITDRLTSTLGLEYRHQESDSSVWDLEDRRWFLNLDLRLNRNGAGYLTYSRISGDTFSSAQRSFCNGVSATDILDLIDAATALEEDDAYNEALCGEWIAYRLDATSNVYTLGYNHGFGHSMALDMSALHADIKGTGGNEYQRTLYRFTVLKRF